MNLVVAVAVLCSSALALQAPNTFTLTFQTDVAGQGPIVVAVNRSWAPLGVDHFYTLVNSAYYAAPAALFRYVPNFVLQFGISGVPATNQKWLTPINDDPFVGNSNTVGTLVYATAGPNTRTTQLFINFVDNSFLDKQGFVPFGVITSGLATAVAAFNPTPGDSNGVDQNEYSTKGNAWIKKNYPKINFITNATTS